MGKTSKSKQRHDPKLLPERKIPGIKRRTDIVEADHDGLGPERGRDTSSGKTPPPGAGADAGSTDQDQEVDRGMTLLERCRYVVKETRFKKKWSPTLKRNLTFCNQFVHYIATAYNCHMFEGKLANEMISLMMENGDLFELQDPDQAQDWANKSKLVIAGWYNPKGHPGHVAIIVEGKLMWSKKHRDDVPLCANVGVNNFCGRPISFAFNKKMKPSYWLWKGGRNGNH